MKDFIFKIRVLFDFLLDACEHWKKEVWNKDLDSYYCCNGYECGCQAVSVRQVFTHQMERKS
jgi:hypothetical protein